MLACHAGIFPNHRIASGSDIYLWLPKYRSHTLPIPVFIICSLPSRANTTCQTYFT
ncbi:hypothetical protein PABG_12073 [Paracoccidioides brasiliensis Pb03]|nr:hypothetical protein PABG_12073 [Paracoccidioides brasiliensis Pb03]